MLLELHGDVEQLVVAAELVMISSAVSLMIAARGS